MPAQSGPRWLNAHEMRFWMAYLGGQKRLHEALDNDLRRIIGIELNDYEVLAILSEQPERRMRMSAVADSVIMGRSRLTYRVDRLENSGLVRREACSDDRRGQFVCLTDEGLELLQRAAPLHVASVRHHLIDRLKGVDLAALADAFDDAGTAPLP